MDEIRRGINDCVTIITLVVLAVFIGALMRTMFGFGEAIVSMPLLALLPIPIHTSVSLIGLAGLTVASLTVVRVAAYRTTYSDSISTLNSDRNSCRTSHALFSTCKCNDDWTWYIFDCLWSLFSD